MCVICIRGDSQDGAKDKAKTKAKGKRRKGESKTKQKGKNIFCFSLIMSIDHMSTNSDLRKLLLL
jgi:hypothetical protein